MSKFKFALTSLALGLALSAATIAALPAQAHHSVAGFDLTKRAGLSGVVSKFEYRNPHGWVFVDAQIKGKTVTYALELGPPAALRRAGLRFDAVKAGDKVSVEFAPSRDGHPQGLLTRIAWSDGRSWEPTGSASPIMPGSAKAQVTRLN